MRFLPLFLGLWLLSGCTQLEAVKDLGTSIQGLITGTDNSEPPRELEPLEPTVNLNVLWKTSVGKGYDDQIVNLVPAVTASTVYAVDRRGLIEAFNRQDGERLWSAETKLELSAGPVVAGDKLLLGCANNYVQLLTVSGGPFQASAESSSSLSSSTNISGKAAEGDLLDHDEILSLTAGAQYAHPIHQVGRYFPHQCAIIVLTILCRNPPSPHRPGG